MATDRNVHSGAASPTVADARSSPAPASTAEAPTLSLYNKNGTSHRRTVCNSLKFLTFRSQSLSGNVERLPSPHSEEARPASDRGRSQVRSPAASGIGPIPRAVEILHRPRRDWWHRDQSGNESSGPCGLRQCPRRRRVVPIGGARPTARRNHGATRRGRYRTSAGSPPIFQRDRNRIRRRRPLFPRPSRPA